ncbi:unnamed protein product [Linum trigynum]|uniref:G-patch domain-containing protein n=2 Tax=Linum trigynum TaxID=586398 RepID=A0AAV2DLM5_9ROSI
MKLSFSISAKSSSKPTTKPILASKDEESEQRQKEYVTEFDPSKSNATLNKPKFIIPPKENEWRPHKRMKNIHSLASLQSDTSANDVRFEVAVDGVDDGSGGNVSYGLNVRQNENGDSSTKDGIGGFSSENSSTENMLLEKLKYDLQHLPDDEGFKEFEDVPVEGFGAALLAGYGWTEGRGIGKNAKVDVEVKQYFKRTDKQGLGFLSHESEMSSDKNKQKEKGREIEKEKDRDGKADGFAVGKVVRVVAGSRGDAVGSKGTVVEILGTEWLVLKLAKTGEELRVHASDVAALGSGEEEKCLKKLKELRIRSEKQSSNGGKSGNRRSGASERTRDYDRIKPDKERGTPWLNNHIRVRIISKDMKGGRLYLKKGEVVDVVGPYICDIAMDGSRELVQGVDQDLLETALPRSGGPVLVLYGKHKGVYGKLVKRDLEKESGVVQDSDTHEFLKVKLEQIAEYIGDPSEIGY